MRRALLISALSVIATPLAAQDRIPQGVQLEGRYTLAGQQALSVQPFTGGGPALQTALQVSQIMENDLRNSDRFRVVPVPDALATGPIDYAQWNSLALTWLVTGVVTPNATGFQAEITLHDAARGNVEQKQTFALPAATAPDYRMAVHIASDEIVRWATGQPGAAATRIVFRRKNVPAPGPRGSGTATETYDIMGVDSDGENLRRLHGSAFQIYSPVWSPDTRKLAWAGRKTQGWALVELDLATGRTRDLHTGPDHMLTPAYSPDGARIAFSVWVPGGFEIFEFDLSRNCCLRRLTDSREDNLSPSYSPDGKTLVFHSTRTGSHHVYAMPSAGGQATQLSPFGAGVSYDAADWSPIGSDVVFQGMYERGKHLMLGDATRFAGQIRQLTSEGWHEDPSWGPDGRHIVFSSNTGLKGQGSGIYILDKVTGNTRRLISGRYLEMPDWSGSFATRGASRQ